MAVNTEEKAGSYLALWSVVQLLSRGAGIAAGGLVRDVALAISGETSTAYAAVFIIEAAGLLGSVWLLARVRIADFVQAKRISAVEVLGAVD